ncbi:ribosomal protection-like ABC-F family protein [Kineothrix sp. MB12-C1]|uniref:ribosomal protection-like ABC-F family protein n=1 Tax=Kineothrix sp. MB12-C1 TaxID=3070215 RepID=UPI0027D2D3B7|nr:ABC-F type ribosomal protection protein [Kineothrix sp. MB12-C1]WMC91123.1 ABC-F type ribosomal protection protein [Kineothrix sp. MB12-C1]
MSQINVNDLTFYYDGSYDNIFENVSFQIDTDWKLGFIARNGRGKTTFLRLLQGKYEYKGTISSSVSFDYFPFEISDHQKDTLAVVEEIYPDYEFWKVCRELTLLQVDTEVLYRPFDTLSNGEQTKVMLAILFSGENSFLLIDEPTNHLDMPTRKLVSDYLNKKKGFLLVSHDRAFLDQCIDHVLTINKTNIEIQKGNFSSWWENKRRKDEYEIAENENLKKDIQRMKESARQSREWADNVEATKIGKKSQDQEKNIDSRAYIGEKSRRMQMRRKNMERRQDRSIEEKSALLKNIESTESLKLFPLRHHKDVLVRMEEVGITYCSCQYSPRDNDLQSITDKCGGKEKQVVHNFNLEIRNGEKIVLEGKNGCGKSSIIKSILSSVDWSFDDSMDEDKENNRILTGSIETAGGLIISYVPQDTSHLKGTISSYAERYGIDETIFKTLLRKLDFSRLQLEKSMEEYSGGQKKKVLIARSLCQQAHLYVWDEPLNFIDVFSRIQIEELIEKYNPTLLMVEHDRTFVEKIGAKIITL